MALIASMALGDLAQAQGTAADEVSAEDQTPPAIVHDPCEYYSLGSPFQVVARFYDRSPIFDPKVIYRKQGGEWSSVSFEKKPDTDDFIAALEERHLGGILEYFIEVFDENGNGPARMGSPDAPLTIHPSAEPVECVQVSDLAVDKLLNDPSQRALLGVIDAPPRRSACQRDDPPVYCRAWFWGVLGTVVVAGVGTVVYLAIHSKDPTPPDDSVRLNVVASDPTSVFGLTW